jgi:4-hydroxybenzoate polyprenyltransferase
MRSLALLRVLRASQWIHFAILPLATLDRARMASPPDLARAALAVVAASLALGYAYGINAFADRASDASPLKNPLAGVAQVPFGAKVVVGAAAILALSMSLFLGRVSTLLLLASLAAATLYSVGPRVKAWPIAGTLLNTAIFAPLLGLAAPEGEALPPGAAALCVTFVGLILQSQLLHEAEDADEDARGRVFTTARLLGPRWTRAAAVGLWAPFAAIAIGLAPGPWLGCAAAAALAGGALVALFKRDWAASRRMHRHVAVAGGGLVFLVRLLS